MLRLLFFILDFLLYFNLTQSPMKHVYIPTNRGTKVVLAANIIRVESSSNYSKIYFSNEQPLLVAKILHWFEDNLPTDMFCRIHRTHIINRLYVTGIFDSSKLALSNGDVIQMSRRKKGSYKLSA